MRYLEELFLRLAVGMESVPETSRQLHSQFLLAAQRADGGFPGREGTSDLYYTGFATRGLALTGQLDGEPAARLAGFLQGQMQRPAAVIDLVSLIYAGRLLESAAGIDPFANCSPQWRTSVAETLEGFRREDGGYAKGPEGAKSSTYHTFLTLLCLELIDACPDRTEAIADFILTQRRDDGGFVEIAPMQRSGTNPTAAAIGTLKILDRLEDGIRHDAVSFLAGMQSAEGGLLANTRIPISDLLSTFTGFWTLNDLGSRARIDVDAMKRYVESLACDRGGFHGAAWDDGTDVEYTFYGIGALALLATELKSDP